MILAIIAIVPILLERIHNEQFDRNERINAAYKQAHNIVLQAAARQNEVIVSTRTLLQVVADTRAAFSIVDQPCNQILKNIADTSPWIRALSIANLDGKIVCSSRSTALGLDISQRQHFINAIKYNKFFISDYFMGTRDKRPLMIAAMPQHALSGSIEAVVLATLDLDWIGQIAAPLGAQDGALMLLVDGKGTVLAHEPNPSNWVGQHLADHPLIKAMLEQPAGVVTTVSLDGVRRLFAFAGLPGTRAHAAIGFDEGAVLSRADRAMWLSFSELGVVTMLVLLSIWFGADRLLVRPIRALVEAAGHIGRGDDKTRAAELPWAAEFVPLAVALDEMAEKLDAREQELRDTNNQLRELAQLDPLTGLANRRTFNSQLMAEWKMAAKLRRPIAVLMIDVDFFKAFNDRYGHVQGDSCLRKVGDVLKSCTTARPSAVSTGRRASDKSATLGRDEHLAARYGGEEFAVLMPGANLEVATRLAEKLRQGVENLLIAHAGAPWGFVSISVGVASIIPSENANAQELTEAADSCLYVGKQRGRNTVVAGTDKPLLRVAS
ncbi:MAG TPA: GGDEF domain-containing protein [Pseudolabrys sp.]|jgi:GGDEF domain-containing protein|nr:GGDEF domain-containing protein [Pseudolabrys sp.]